MLAAAAVWQLTLPYPPPGRPAHVRLPAGAAVRALVPGVLRTGRARRRSTSEVRLLAQSVARSPTPSAAGSAAGDAGRRWTAGPLRDPLAYGRTPEHPLPAPILGHSDYQADPAFAEERAALLARLGATLPRQPGAAARRGRRQPVVRAGRAGPSG